MIQFLTPEEVQTILDRNEPCPAGIVEDYYKDPDCGPALRVFLALEENKAGENLSELDRLYNRYFWLCKFANIYTIKYGEDEGIEQQVFGILSDATCEFDWEVIEELHNKAEADSESFGLS